MVTPTWQLTHANQHIYHLMAFGMAISSFLNSFAFRMTPQLLGKLCTNKYGMFEGLQGLGGAILSRKAPCTTCLLPVIKFPVMPSMRWQTAATHLLLSSLKQCAHMWQCPHDSRTTASMTIALLRLCCIVLRDATHWHALAASHKPCAKILTAAQLNLSLMHYLFTM